MIRLAIIASLLAACSKTASEPPAPPERTDMIRRGDAPLTIVGKTLDVGDPMPDVTLSGFKLEPIQLSSLRGKVIVLSVVPSIDTKVCEVQSHRMSDSVDLLPKGAEIYTVSRDLPFAQSRFYDEAVMRIKMGSDYKDGKIAYRQIVADQSTEPDYDALIAAAKRAAGA